MRRRIVVGSLALAALAACGSTPAATSGDLPPPPPVIATTSTTTSSTTTASTVAPLVVPEADLVIVGTLIDGTGAEPLPDTAVVIGGDTIVAVGPRETLAVPGGVAVVDVPGTTILPGLINAHVHNAYELVNLQMWATSGVTTVRDLGARWDGGKDYLYLAGYYSERQPRAARVVASGPLVTVPGGYPIAGNRFESLTVTSPEDAREKIDALIDEGAAVIKITITVGGPPTLTLEEATAIVETAHARGIPVTAHADGVASLERALDAGVDDIAHAVGGRLPDALIERMVAEDVGWVPTLAILDGFGGFNVRRFADAGGRVALGNDAGFLRGVLIGLPANEIEAMTVAGFEPMEIIVAATGEAAAVCGLEDVLGTIEPGKLADLLVVDGDPLADLGVLDEVLLVVRSGMVIRDDR